MKILVYTDTHNSHSAFEKIKEKAKKHKPEIAICCGDFTIFMQQAEAILKQIDSMKIKTYIIHGNHEDEAALAKMCKKFPNIVFLHEKSARHNDVLIIGYGGGGFSMKDYRFEEIAKSFEKAISQCKGCKRILMLHQPPYKSGIDYVYGEYAGNKTFRNFVDKHGIEIVFAGHLHENSAKAKKIGKTVFINPGPLGKIFEV